MEADKKALEQAVATDRDALENLRIADEEMAAALFGNATQIGEKRSPKKTGDMELIRSSADGKRHEWRGTFLFGGVSDSRKEVSLLD